MKLFVALFALVAVAAAQVSNEYLPPNYGGDADPSEINYSVAAASAPGVSYETAAAAPAHSFSADDGYRYKTHRRRVYKTVRRHRRDVSTEYLPPAASAPSASFSAPSNEYLAPAASYNVEASAPAAFESYETAATAPAHSFSADDGYRYKTHRRRVVKVARRHRRDVSTEYLPPAASAPSASFAGPSNEYLAPAASYNVEASAPAAFESYETAASAPAHSFSADDGYRYKTHRRRVVKVARRHRRDVSTEYLPPAASAPSASFAAPSNEYLAPAASYNVEASAPAAFESYETAASAPAHSFSADDGYRYKTHRRRVFKTARRHRRDVSTEYLPPAASAPSASFAAPSNEYLAPAASYNVEASAPAAFESYETAAAAPAHSFSSDDGYRYKTHRRRVVKVARRHRRGVSTEYLPPAASSSFESYAAPAASYSSASYSTPSESYSIEAAAPGGVHETYETAGAAPAHSFSSADGYRYKTVRRRVIRRRKLFVALFALVAVAAAQVSNEYLPPNYGGDADPSEINYSVAAASAPGVSYETAAAAPAHSFSADDGYRYKTHRRRVYKTVRRHRRDVSTEYLPPAASAPSASFSAPSNEYLAPAASYNVEASAPAAFESYETAATAPAHSFSADDGYRYKTHRRRVVKVARRHRRDVSTEYLPPAASAPSASFAAPSNEYLAPAASYNVEASAPAAFESYETAASAPAHSFSADDGYRYKTHRRRVVKVARRHRRDVSTEYLPPAASAPSASFAAPSNEYLAPAASYNVEASAPAAFESYETAASAPAHSFSADDGYRYKTHRRRVFKTARRHRRDVSTEYLPPAASAPSASFAAPSNEYLAPAASYNVEASAPAAFESYETAAAAPAHSFSSDDGYRYKTHRRRVVKVARRHRRGVSTEYLPPAASSSFESYAAPAASYSSASYSTPSESYSIEAAAPGGVHETYETAGAAPAHSFSSADGYRYKTVRRRVIRRRV